MIPFAESRSRYLIIWTLYNVHHSLNVLKPVFWLICPFYFSLFTFLFVYIFVLFKNESVFVSLVTNALRALLCSSKDFEQQRASSLIDMREE
jgi:hypothetical protein